MLDATTLKEDKVLLDQLDVIIAEFEQNPGITVGCSMRVMHRGQDNLYRWNGGFDHEASVGTEHGDVESWQQTQGETFEDLTSMRYKMQGLASFVQNDYESLLNDGHTTKAQILETALAAASEFDKVIAELLELKQRVDRVLMHYGTACREGK